MSDSGAESCPSYSVVGKTANKSLIFTVRLLGEGPRNSQTLWYIFEPSAFLLFTLCECIQAWIKLLYIETLPNLWGGDPNTAPSCAAGTSPVKWREFGFGPSLHCSLMQRAAITSCLPRPRPAGGQDNRRCYSPAVS